MALFNIHNHLRVIVLLSGLFVSACDNTKKDNRVVLNGFTMGTTYSVQLVEIPGSKSADIISVDIKNILNDINLAMSTWRDDSELSLLNKKRAGEWIPVSPDLLYVLDLAQKVGKKTQGAFDMTLDPLIELWGFSSNKEITSVPGDSAIRRSLQLVGYQYLIIDTKRQRIKKVKPIRINLSAIAKGYAVDKIADYLDKQGIASYLVEVGGELRLKGTRQGNIPWKVAVEEPIVGQRKASLVLHLKDMAVATSGDYRNYYEVNGKHYSHTIDPQTGYPVTHNLASVTVLEKNTAYADALATAIMVMGPEKGYVFCMENEIPAYFIIKNHDKLTYRYTSFIKDYFNEKIIQ